MPSTCKENFSEVCCDCGILYPNKIMHKVYAFDDEDGREDLMCNDCYEEHESKGDWCS